MKILAVGLLTVLIFSQMAFAAIPKKSLSVESALRLPAEERVSLLRRIGPKSYRDLHAVAFDPSRPYDIRWRAVVSMAWLGGKESIVDLEKALDNPDWFMRDAGLKGMEKIDKAKTSEWAKKLLGDPALVVRSAAVQIIQEMHDTTAESALWEKINAPENFRGEQSLFIRRQILSALSDFATKGNEDKFAQFLTDKDKSLHIVAMEGIERATGIRKDEDPRKSLQLWRKQYANFVPQEVVGEKATDKKAIKEY
jgi:hypothetical protein